MQKKVFKGKTLFHAKPMNLKGFPKFDNSFFSKIGQEVEFPETEKNQLKIVMYTKPLIKRLRICSISALDYGESKRFLRAGFEPAT